MNNQQSFSDYLQLEKNYSPLTINAYVNDIRFFQEFILETFEQDNLLEVNYPQIRNWIVSLSDKEISNKSINRKISSLKAFYRFLLKTKQIQINPLSKHKSLKSTTKLQIPFSEKELDNSSEKRLVPLIYPESIKPGKVLFPPKKPRKSIAIENNQQTQKWLIQPGWYVLIKRFSAKEEKRRIVAAVCSPLDSPALGIENHLNYYHAKGRGVNPDLARGLAAFLNSTLFDNYFRLFSGNTQVNVTDLRKIRYPSKEDLMKLGSQIDEFVFDQEKLDTLVHKNLSIMSEALNAIQASKRIQEALTILKQISAPKEQQNERSALCLLALADIRPETSWNQATTPKRRITEMMDWFRDFYGKQYAPNTRETVRRQTMYQFVQMGLVLENPDQLNRPINSPKWCYQLQQKALLLIQSYNSDQWEESCCNYAISVKNLWQDRTRNIPTIPNKKENLS
jgi:adenine-specific DNA-methyltransferase